MTEQMTGQMTGQLTVELADLRGWADQVGRAGGDCEQLAGYLSTFVPDGDFGRLLSLLTPDYEALVVRVRDVLEVDGARLAGTRAGLRHVARRYERTDDRVAQSLGEVSPSVTTSGSGPRSSTPAPRPRSARRAAVRCCPR